MNIPALSLKSWIRPVATGLAVFVATSILATPTPVFADRKAQREAREVQSSREQRYTRQDKQRVKQRQASREHRKYNHYESEKRVRDLHDNPDRQPYYIKDNLGIKIQF